MNEGVDVYLKAYVEKLQTAQRGVPCTTEYLDHLEDRIGDTNYFIVVFKRIDERANYKGDCSYHVHIFDEDGDFLSSKLNTEMVKTYPLVECEDGEIEKVKNLISSHLEHTGSLRAKYLLTEWDDVSQKFIKVMPEDYERVLLALKRAEESGLQGDEAIQAAFEENVAAGH